ncbi:MAG TPA: hypothetical protein VKA84_09655 [Gemmatimonadaceae bacterium]|nr:hypothetical protein [Gemmatimonadaceae bacterium]
MADATFTYRGARSGSLLAGLALAILVETVALHAWLRARHPLVAWALTLASLAAIAWLAADYRAMGRGAVRVTPDALDLRVGRRLALTLRPSDVATAARAGWRDVPEAGTPAAAEYVNPTKPAEPNVLLTLREPATVRLVAGVTRRVRRVGLHLDDPDGFLVAVRRLREQLSVVS